MLSLGGVRHLTGGSRKKARVTCDTLLNLVQRKAVELTVDDGATVVVQAGQPPVVDGSREERMRVGCGSATIGMFAKQWFGKVDEVVVVDDHITGSSLRTSGWKASRRPRDRHQNERPPLDSRPLLSELPNPAQPGAAPISTIRSPSWNPSTQKSPGPDLRLLMVSTTGEHHAYFELDEICARGKRTPESAQRLRRPHQRKLRARPLHGPLHGRRRRLPPRRRHRKSRPPHPLRARRPHARHLRRRPRLRLARRRHHLHGRRDAACPNNAFGYVPTPALVAPIEFTLKLEDYAAWAAIWITSARSATARGNDAGGSVTAQPRKSLALNHLARGHGIMRTRARFACFLLAAACIFHDGPIDLISKPDRTARNATTAPTRPRSARFVTVLDELCAELPSSQPGHEAPRSTQGTHCATHVPRGLPYAERRFITPMAAVAGAVAEEMLCSDDTPPNLTAPTSTTAATSPCTLRPGEHFAIGMIDNRRPSLFGTTDASRAAHQCAASPPAAGAAAAFSLGIADAVTVLADSAAQADAAATIIANAVESSPATQHHARPRPRTRARHRPRPSPGHAAVGH